MSNSKILELVPTNAGATNHPFSVPPGTPQTPESAADRRKRWLGVIAYEVWMLRNLRKLGEAKALQLTITASMPAAEARTLLQCQARVIANALCESQVLHARNLCDFCTAPRREQKEKEKREKRQRKHPDEEQPKSRNEAFLENDIKPSDLFKDYAPDEYRTLLKMIDDVDTEYRKQIWVLVVQPDGTSTSVCVSPKDAFDKKLAHPTQERSDNFNYEPFLNVVVPKIEVVVDEIRRLENIRGRDLGELSRGESHSARYV